MENHLGIISLIIGIVLGSIGILSTLWKLFSLVAALREADKRIYDAMLDGDRELVHRMDKLELTFNGVRERMEHVNVKLDGQMKDCLKGVNDVEGFLLKTTTYEPKRR